jgi:hypothetical protein
MITSYADALRVATNAHCRIDTRPPWLRIPKAVRRYLKREARRTALAEGFVATDPIVEALYRDVLMAFEHDLHIREIIFD